MKTFRQALVALAATTVLASAHAGVIYTSGPLSGAPVASPSTLTSTFASGAGSANLSFDLTGYGSLDGDSEYIDVFSLFINGTKAYAGTFNMGGGGVSHDFYNPGNLATTHTITYGDEANPASQVATFQGGKTTIVLPVTLQAGVNTIDFSYDSPHYFDGISRAGPQPFFDESWNVTRVSVITSAVPEPETYALMLAGLLAVGSVARRRGTKQGA